LETTEKEISEEKDGRRAAIVWWTDEGFVWQKEPESFLPTKGQYGDWKEILKSAGYEQDGSSIKDGAMYELEIYNHDSGHFLVEIWDWNRCLSKFFVSSVFENVFFATWYLEFAHRVSQMEQADQIKELARILLKKK
jgi:hypothetical protein